MPLFFADENLAARARGIIAYIDFQLRASQTVQVPILNVSEELVRELSNNIGEIGWSHDWSSLENCSTILTVQKTYLRTI